MANQAEARVRSETIKKVPDLRRSPGYFKLGSGLFTMEVLDEPTALQQYFVLFNSEQFLSASAHLGDSVATLGFANHRRVSQLPHCADGNLLASIRLPS